MDAVASQPADPEALAAGGAGGGGAGHGGHGAGHSGHGGGHSQGSHGGSTSSWAAAIHGPRDRARRRPSRTLPSAVSDPSSVTGPGLDPSTGARPLRRSLQRHIQDPVSEILITEPDDSIMSIAVEVEGGELDFLPTRREVGAEAT